MTQEEIKNTFRYHSPNPASVVAHEQIRKRMTALVIDIAGMIPHSRERSLFISLCQQAQMMANAAIAIHSPEAE